MKFTVAIVALSSVAKTSRIEYRRETRTQL
jgi:hypothetical protein